MKNLVTTNFTLWFLDLATGVQVLKMSHYRHERKWLTAFQDSVHSKRVSFVIDFIPLAYARPQYVGCSNYDAANMDVNSEQVRLVRTSASLTQRTIMLTLYYKAACDKTRGHAVAQLVEALRYKPEGRGFDSSWCHWNFSLT